MKGINLAEAYTHGDVIFQGKSAGTGNYTCSTPN
jgi:hypothetical protein